MNLRFSALCLAVLGGIGGLGASSTAEAAVIGEYQGEYCNIVGTLETLQTPVTSAGHTWVRVAQTNEQGLRGIDVLVVRECGVGFSYNALINAAVHSGMGLVTDSFSLQTGGIDPAIPSGDPRVPLPGFPVLGPDTQFCPNNVSIASGAPIANGPGGPVTDDSLDRGGPGGMATGYCTIGSMYSVAALPSGFIPFVVSPDGRDAAAFGYPHGAGRVAVSLTSASSNEIYKSSQYIYSGAKAYLLNAIAWTLDKPVSAKTCASEGYTGTKLTWCQNICEKGYTGATLSMWIKRWTDKYRELPYCAREK